jgi:hypothetical protein
MFPIELCQLLLQYDNGGRFDLRLPSVEVGYVTEDSDFMGKLARLFRMGRKKSNSDEKSSDDSAQG